MQNSCWDTCLLVKSIKWAFGLQAARCRIRIGTLTDDLPSTDKNEIEDWFLAYTSLRLMDLHIEKSCWIHLCSSCIVTIDVVTTNLLDYFVFEVKSINLIMIRTDLRLSAASFMISQWASWKLLILETVNVGTHYGLYFVPGAQASLLVSEVANILAPMRAPMC